MRYLIGTILFLNCLMYGQQTNTVYQNLVTNTGTSPFTSTTVTNIGQSNHQVSVTLSNAPGKTCSNFTVLGQLQYSYDTAIWLAFGAPTSGSSTLAPATWYGSGAYPYVQFYIAGFDNVNCRLTAYYSGTIQGVISPKTTGLQQAGTIAIQPQSPIIVGGITGVIGTAPYLTTATICNQTVSQNVAANGTFRNLIQNIGAGTVLRICSLALNSDGAGGTTIEFASFDDVNTSCTNFGLDIFKFTLGQYGVLTLGNGLSPAITDSVNIGRAYCIKGTGAGNFSFTLNYAAVPSATVNCPSCN
jgi:hypothetical protein